MKKLFPILLICIFVLNGCSLFSGAVKPGDSAWDSQVNTTKRTVKLSVLSYLYQRPHGTEAEKLDLKTKIEGALAFLEEDITPIVNTEFSWGGIRSLIFSYLTGSNDPLKIELCDALLEALGQGLGLDQFLHPEDIPEAYRIAVLEIIVTAKEALELGLYYTQ